MTKHDFLLELELQNNTQVFELLEKFYGKLPLEELAAMVQRVTGLPILPAYISYILRNRHKRLKLKKKPVRRGIGRPSGQTSTNAQYEKARSEYKKSIEDGLDAKMAPSKKRGGPRANAHKLVSNND